MKQILIKKGEIYIDNIPTPTCGENEILVKVHYSLISTGTEMASILESGKSILQRVKEQPENLKSVLEMVKKQGLKKTYNLVRGILESGNPTGYSAAGEVIEVGKNIKDIVTGDRVACAGAGKANHAEVISVPRNLIVKIPNNVDFSDAASVTLGTIALQGIRQANPELGDSVVVIGLGLLGLLSVQMLKANGCKVIGIDFSEKRRKLAKEFGAELTISASEDTAIKVLKETDGIGADRIIITAASDSNEIVNNAMQMVRKKGTVVVVGAVGLGLKRSPFYEKEVDFKISCSYGPGRYDTNYEENGIDYPVSYVRWTENRNMSEYLSLISAKQVNFKKIVEAEYIIDEAVKAYDDLKLSSEKPMAVLLRYPDNKNSETIIKLNNSTTKHLSKKIINVAIIGAGNFATAVHLPNLEKLEDRYNIQAIIDKNGVLAKQTAEKYGAKYAGTDYKKILDQKDIDMVIVTTRHNTHAEISIEALKKGKSVFCEKPMAINLEELDKLTEQIQKSKGIYTVGFNRRFSPYAEKIKKLTEGRQNPLMIYYRMNAGYIALDHWVHNKEGGGRIIGEGCHIFDLFNYLTGSEIISINTECVEPTTGYYSNKDNKIITIKYADGSLCTLVYTALGNSDQEKEYIELYYDNKSIIVNDYKEIKGYGIRLNHKSDQDKGHLVELKVFANSISNGQSPIPIEDLISATKASFLADN